jgi:hypothetical protein
MKNLAPVVLISICLGVVCNALADEQKAISFVSCPIYRDTDAGRKSGCWLADHRAGGLRYDITDSQIKPIAGREVLVEGIVAGKPDTCGGIQLLPVRVSVLPTSCPVFLLPAEQYKGRPYILPAKTLSPTFAPQPTIAPPFANRRYTIYFELNSDFLMYQHAEVMLDDAARFVMAAKPKRVVITAYAATRPVVISEHKIVESMDAAKRRAAMIVEALTRLNIPRELIKVETKGDPAPEGDLAAAGLGEASKRRANVRIEL